MGEMEPHCKIVAFAGKLVLFVADDVLVDPEVFREVDLIIRVRDACYLDIFADSLFETTLEAKVEYLSILEN